MTQALYAHINNKILKKENFIPMPLMSINAKILKN
jgi:hypothetical protein